ncbi:N-acetylmuramidase family protein [Burkholderia sp. FERM BP-3421]|jgi:hypothetical protein|uniref:N-acetylmuramidase family protein n=1 Tax=Burkholderia sp. FERM BP-3421 TaxID=1494466 RepID=UPI002360E268|nr:N-acetylmuramidase family protein [Burkholderia sp. FERM BP-3421]WDD95938.1 N-acetylmuramidase family protein [Burkholderia sp. FERM BP-3421]
MTVRLNDAGPDVALLQRQLTRAGYPLVATGRFDAVTQSAVIALQRDRALAVDGIAGPATWIALERAVQPAPLEAAELAAVAARLDAPLAAVRAVAEVESRGNGFLPDGRPVILFERHQFWKRLAARGIAPAPLAASCPDILATTPGGYAGGAAEYARLARAEAIDLAAADEAASWGAFQIMGFHWSRLGYASIDDFVLRMRAGAAEQLDAFARFVGADPTLLDALRRQAWAAFARGYNGPDYARNQYDAKLARVYAQYARPA